MRSHNHSNALLVELLIVILFFMLAATILLQVFAAARSQSAKAELLSTVSVEAQNLAERLYAAPDAEILLSDLGFSEKEGQWIMETDAYITEVSISQEPTESGQFLRQQVLIRAGDEILITLPCSRYVEVIG